MTDRTGDHPAASRDEDVKPAQAVREEAGAAGTVDRLSLLQSLVGNRAVGRLVQRSTYRSEDRTLARRPIQVNIPRLERRTQNRAYDVRARYEVDFTPFECTITLRVRLVPDGNVTQAQTDAVKAEAEQEFLRLWDNKFYFDETVTGRIPFIDPNATSTDRYFVRFRILWVSSREHARVRLSRGPGRDNAGRWFVTGSVPIDRAHELSHLLGLFDEYIDPSVPRRRNASAAGVFTDYSLLGDYYAQGIAHAEVKLRHGEQLARDIGRVTRRRFTAHYSGSYQGERLVRWRGIRDAAAAGSAERTRAEAEVRSIEAEMMIPQLGAAAGAGTP